MRIPTPHRVIVGALDKDSPTVCLIVKDSSLEWTKKEVEAAALNGDSKSGLSAVQEVISLTKLRKDFSQYEQRRELVQSFDLFLADDRILPMLSKALGKTFFSCKKQPVPIKLTRKDSLAHVVRRSLHSSTYMLVGTGTTITVKSGSPAVLSQGEIAENVKQVIEKCAEKVGWSNVRGVDVRIGDSVGLPVYARTTKELEEIAKTQMAASTSSFSDGDRKAQKDGAEEGEAEIVAKKLKSTSTKKSKKQSSSSESGSVVVTKKSPLLDKLREQQRVASLGQPKKIKGGTKRGQDERKKGEDDREGEGEVAAEKLKKKKKIKTGKKAVTEGSEPSSSSSAAAVASVGGSSSSPSSEFVKCRKFDGSKGGMVFKKGPLGLGYYVDLKPVVEPGLMRAILGNGGGRGKGKGKKRRR